MAFILCRMYDYTINIYIYIILFLSYQCSYIYIYIMLYFNITLGTNKHGTQYISDLYTVYSL